jgi:transcriptional regulator of acetoin/glycerol metabolism
MEGMHTDRFASHINRITESLQGGKALRPESEHEFPLVIDSWQRCLKAYGLDPAEPHSTSVVDTPTLKERREKAGSLLDIARQEMECLFKMIAGSGFSILLTDAEGIIINNLCDTAITNEFRNAGLWLGANWNEKSEGTNGIGTCIVEGRALTIHGHEHFRGRNIGLSCTASPIFDPQGALLGVLDFSSVNCRESKLSQLHTRALVRLSANLIERHLFSAEYQNEFLLHFNPHPECAGLSNDGILALSEGGDILAANQSALELLGNLRRPYLISRSINEVFDTSPTSLQLRVRKRTRNYWCIRERQRGQQFFAFLSRKEKPSRWNSSPFAPSAQDTSDRSLYRGFSIAAIPGEDPKMIHNKERAHRVIDKGIPILLCGDTGTGKEEFARAIHASSQRKGQNFVAINCASIPESLIESELFGYAHGAFTGARRQGMKGKIIQANGGTLFLDEIGDMPMHLQSRLLRVLEEKEVCPLGCERPVAVDFNVISATHRDLCQFVDQDRFREDLYYRLNGLHLTLPRLRDREDKERLIYELLASENDSNERITIDDTALEQLLAYPWPGNIRQLKNALRVAIALCRRGIVKLTDLPPPIADWTPENASRSSIYSDPELTIEEQYATADPESPEESSNMLESAEREALLMALASHCWNITDTATMLGISRATLYRKLKKYGLPPSKPR